MVWRVHPNTAHASHVVHDSTTHLFVFYPLKSVLFAAIFVQVWGEPNSDFIAQPACVMEQALLALEEGRDWQIWGGVG